MSSPVGTSPVGTSTVGSHGALVLAGGTQWLVNGGLARTLAATQPSAPNAAVVVPSAAAFDGPDRAIDVVRSATPGVDIISADIVGRHDAERTDLAATLGSARCVVAVGESSMHLRSVMKATPAWDAVLDGWSAGATFVAVGWSAAAMGDPMIDPRGGALTLGLGLVPVSILPGADHWGVERTKRTLKMAKGWLVTLDSAGAATWTPAGGWGADGGGVRAYFGGQERPLAELPGPAVPA
jgi:cyanophycinase